MSEPIDKLALPGSQDAASHERGGSPGSNRIGLPLDALDQLSDGYYEMDQAFRYTRVNEAGARLMRMTAEQLLGRSVLELYPQLETSTVHSAVRRVMAGGPPEHVEIYFPPLRIWGVNSIYPIPSGVAIVSRDITAQKLLEQNLAFLAEASKVLSSSLDYESTLRAVAALAVPTIADWCGIDMLIGEDTVEQLAVAHVDPAKVAWAKELRRQQPPDLSQPQGLGLVLRTGVSQLYPEITEAMLVAAAPNQRTVELARSLQLTSIMIVPLSIHGRVIGAITFASAESGRHYTPSDLSTAEELAGRAALAIENARLFGESQRAVAIRDDFIAVASHELKTPVTSLKVYAQVMHRQAEKAGDEASVRTLAKINDQIDRLSELIGDLLDISKIEAGELALASDEVALDEVVTAAVEAVQQTSPKHSIEIEGSVTRPIFGDADRLGQVVTNLLTNAIKYSPSADRVIVRILDEKRRAAVEVEDFGIGMDPDHLPHIFERFYRVSSPDEKTFPGLGIGLYISSEIVRRHGGEMSVRSAKGEGSIFRFTIPVANDGGHRDGREVSQ